MKYLILIMMLLSFQSVVAENDDNPQDDKEIDQALKEAPATKDKNKKNPQILDFEADVIEGQRKAPQLFLQMEIEAPNLDTVIYYRKNFNDFHVVEKDRRPLYQPVGKAK